MEARAAAAVGRWLQRCVKEDHPNLLFIPDSENALVTYFMVVGLGGKDRGCEYIFRLTSPKEFPQKPPSLSCMTANDTFSRKCTKICISIGEFHSSERSKDGASGWRPAQGLLGFAREVLNGILCPGSLESGGIGVIVGSKKPEGCAADSKAYNEKNNAELRKSFLEAAKDKKAGKAWKMYQNQELLKTAIKLSASVGSALSDAKTQEKFAAAFGEEVAKRVSELCLEWEIDQGLAMRSCVERFCESDANEQIAWLAIWALSQKTASSPIGVIELIWSSLFCSLSFLEQRAAAPGARGVCVAKDPSLAGAVLTNALAYHATQDFAQRDTLLDTLFAR